MATILISPAGTPFIPPGGQTAEEWFESISNDPSLPNFETEKCVAFAASHLNQLINNKSTNPPQLIVLSKQEHEGKKTLAVGGVDASNNLIANNKSLFLIGTPSDMPTSEMAFPLDFSQIKSDIEGKWDAPESITNPTGSFKNQMKIFQTTPFQVNLSRTVKFEAAIIRGIIKDNQPDKIVFLPGFIYFIPQDLILESGGFDLPIHSNIPIEILLAFAINSSNEIIGNPVVPFSNWPLRWP